MFKGPTTMIVFIYFKPIIGESPPGTIAKLQGYLIFEEIRSCLFWLLLNKFIKFKGNIFGEW